MNNTQSKPKLDLSLNEFQAMSHKAARGSGYPVGLADNLVAAIAELNAASHPVGACVLAGLGSADKQSQMGQIGPALLTSSHFYTITDAPVFLELAAASDREMRGLMTNVDAPLLCLGYVMTAAKTYGLTTELQFGNGTRALVDANDVNLNGDIPGERCDVLFISEVEEQVAIQNTKPKRIRVEQDEWEKISALAAKTYVPATEASRIKGAGEGTVSGLMEKD